MTLRLSGSLAESKAPLLPAHSKKSKAPSSLRSAGALHKKKGALRLPRKKSEEKASNLRQALEDQLNRKLNVTAATTGCLDCRVDRVVDYLRRDVRAITLDE